MVGIFSLGGEFTKFGKKDIIVYLIFRYYAINATNKKEDLIKIKRIFKITVHIY